MSERRCLVTANYLAPTLKSLLSGFAHCCSAAFLVCFGALHVMVGTSPRFPSLSYEFLEPLTKIRPEFCSSLQKSVIKPGVWLNVWSRILYFFVFVLRLLRKAITSLFASVRPYSHPRGIARLSLNWLPRHFVFEIFNKTWQNVLILVEMGQT
jgi:hypothetical protein